MSLLTVNRWIVVFFGILTMSLVGVCQQPAGNAQPDDGIQDLADKAASAYSKELNFSLSDGERNVLMLIDEAFVRIKEGAFGMCTNCGNTIGEKRLQAVPWTPLCIDCQELQEKGLLS